MTEITISAENIKKIGGYLETGDMLCYYHIPTGKVLSAPDPVKYYDMDNELWDDVYKEIDEKISECIVFRPLESREGFEIMEAFSENEVDDKVVRARLITALSKPKPFGNFNTAVRYDAQVLKAWYAYKTQRYIDHAKNEVAAYNSQKMLSEKCDEGKED